MYNETPNPEELVYTFLGTGAFLFFVTFVTHCLFPEKVSILYPLFIIYFLIFILGINQEKKSRERKKIEAFFRGKEYKVKYRLGYKPPLSKGCAVTYTVCQDAKHPYRLELRIIKVYTHSEGTNTIVKTKYISFRKFKKEMYRVY